MSIHLVGVIVLALVFVLGTARPVNIGVFALIATFLLGTTLGGESIEDLLSGFPADILILLVGVTYLFGLAATNGTLEWVVERAVRAFGDRPALVPWLIFIFSSIPTLAGALGPAGVAMLAPLCLRLGERYGLSRRMSALMVMHGSCAGNFSPINGLAIIALNAAEQNGLEVSGTALFFGNLAYNIGLGIVIYFGFGGRRLLAQGRAQRKERALVASGGSSSTVGGTRGASSTSAVGSYTDLLGHPKTRIRVDQVATLVVIVAVAIASLVYDFDLGFVALTAAALLHTIFANRFDGADKKIVWSVVLLICGITTLVAALQRYGTIERLGEGIAGMAVPLLTVFVLFAVGAVTSAFGSSAGLIGVLVPLAVPFIATGNISATWVLVGLCISATVVDAMPFSSVGALTLSTAPEDERPKLFRFMLVWGAAMIVSAPTFTWLFFILPTSF
ncbi:MAG: SLC13 family permease [Microbacterium sp.]